MLFLSCKPLFKSSCDSFDLRIFQQFGTAVIIWQNRPDSLFLWRFSCWWFCFWPQGVKVVQHKQGLMVTENFPTFSQSINDQTSGHVCLWARFVFECILMRRENGFVFGQCLETKCDPIFLFPFVFVACKPKSVEAIINALVLEDTCNQIWYQRRVTKG